MMQGEKNKKMAFFSKKVVFPLTLLLKYVIITIVIENDKPLQKDIL